MAELLNRWTDLLINILGVIIGGLLAYAIAKWQYKKQSNETTRLVENQHKEAIRRDQEILTVLWERLIVETRDNRETIRQICAVLAQTITSRDDIWNWAEKFTFSRSAYDELLRSGLQRNLPADILKEVYITYNMTFNCSNMIIQGRAAHQYHMNFTNGQEFANQEFNKVLTNSRTVLDHLNYSVDLFYNQQVDSFQMVGRRSRD